MNDFGYIEFAVLGDNVLQRIPTRTAPTARERPCLDCGAVGLHHCAAAGGLSMTVDTKADAIAFINDVKASMAELEDEVRLDRERRGLQP